MGEKRKGVQSSRVDDLSLVGRLPFINTSLKKARRSALRSSLAMLCTKTRLSVLGPINRGKEKKEVELKMAGMNHAFVRTRQDVQPLNS